jgi:hypothetical protein
MQVYEAREGDSPANIAVRYAGCPKCAVDLIRANPHKPTITFPNGFITFQSLHPGERLWLPDKWFNGEMDQLPPEYFAALPYADGVTPGKGALGQAPAPQPAPATTFTGPQSVADVLGAAQAAAAAIAADPNFCQSVQQAGSKVNAAVHDFKVAWNAVPNNPLPVPLGTGTFEKATADAMATVLGSNAPAACPALAAPAPTPAPSPVPAPAATPTPHKGMSTGAMVGLGLLGAGTVGGIIYLATHHKPAPRGRRRGTSSRRAARRGR